MQHTCPAPKTPCQLTLQPPSWLVMESALGPVRTTFAVGDSGNVLFWLLSSVMDSWAAFSVRLRPAVTAASAALALTQGWVYGAAAHGRLNKPRFILRVRIRVTA